MMQRLGHKHERILHYDERCYVLLDTSQSAREETVEDRSAGGNYIHVYYTMATAHVATMIAPAQTAKDSVLRDA
jgi:hypothetical protein